MVVEGLSNYVPGQRWAIIRFVPIPVLRGPFRYTADSPLEECFLEKSEWLTDMLRKAAQGHLYALSTPLNPDTKASPTVLPLFSWKLLRWHEVQNSFRLALLIVTDIFWIVIKRQVCCKFHKSVLSLCSAVRLPFSLMSPYVTACPSQSQVDWKCLTNFWVPLPVIGKTGPTFWFYTIPFRTVLLR